MHLKTPAGSVPGPDSCSHLVHFILPGNVRKGRDWTGGNACRRHTGAARLCVVLPAAAGPDNCSQQPLGLLCILQALGAQPGQQRPGPVPRELAQVLFAACTAADATTLLQQPWLGGLCFRCPGRKPVRLSFAAAGSKHILCWTSLV